MQPSTPSTTLEGSAGEDSPRRREASGSPLAGEATSTVLDRVRAELVDLHAAVLTLQRNLGPTLAAAAADGGVMEASQQLDLVAQSLDGLSTFLDELGRGGRSSGRLDATRAAAQVKLDRLSSRLAGHPSPEPPATDRGDIDFF